MDWNGDYSKLRRKEGTGKNNRSKIFNIQLSRMEKSKV